MAAKNAIAILKEYGEQKYMIQLTPANWKDANKKYENVKFTYLDESKTILGYNCKKAIGNLKMELRLQCGTHRSCSGEQRFSICK